MTSPQAVNSYCAKVYNALSIQQLGVIFTDYPELLFSKYGIAAMLQTIPKLVRKHHEVTFCWEFIKQIIDAMQKRNRNLYDADRYIDQRGNSPSTWARDILRCYIGAVIDESAGDCLERNESFFSKDALHVASQSGLNRPEEYLGFIFLLFNFTIQDGYSKVIWKRYLSADTIRCFLNVFADSCVALEHPDISIDIFTRTWLDLMFDREDKHHRWPMISMMEKVDVGGFCKAAEKYLQEMAVKHCVIETSLRSDISDLFVHLSNIVKDDFGRETYFYEYIALIASEYSTMSQRFDIAERYSKYFDNDAILYMADIKTSVMKEYGSVTNYRDTCVNVADNNMAARIESIILNIRTSHPDVPKRVVELFFRDTLNAFGRGVNGAAPGCMLSVDGILDSVYKKLENITTEDALEALEAIHEAELAMAMEADGDATTEDITKHEKAKVKPREAMKSAERKIYAGYKKYKEAETNVDNQLSKGLGMLKRAVTGDQQAILIEGKKFSPVGFLKKAMATVAIFNVSKIGLIIALIVKKALTRKTKVTERRKILQQLEEELVLVNEKIEDARGDSNREAKYALMRNKQALENAIKRIKFGIGAEQSRDDMGSQVTGYKG